MNTLGLRSCALAIVVGSVALLGGACGGSAKDDASSSGKPVVIDAGQVDIQLPPGWKVTKGGVERPGTAAATGKDGAGAKPGAATDDTVPLAKEDPTTKFFKAIRTFSGCLKELGVKFIGAPDQSNPNSPTNNPDYLKNLSTCAAKSNILQALKDQQAAQDDLTPEQIKEQNEGYLKWRDCMIGRGWGIPKPKPDAKGRLFSFGTSGQPPAFEPPPGEDIVTSDDTSRCAAEIQQQTNAGG